VCVVFFFSLGGGGGGGGAAPPPPHPCVPMLSNLPPATEAET